MFSLKCVHIECTFRINVKSQEEVLLKINPTRLCRKEYWISQNKSNTRPPKNIMTVTVYIPSFKLYTMHNNRHNNVWGQRMILHGVLVVIMKEINNIYKAAFYLSTRTNTHTHTQRHLSQRRTRTRYLWKSGGGTQRAEAVKLGARAYTNRDQKALKHDCDWRGIKPPLNANATEKIDWFLSLCRCHFHCFGHPELPLRDKDKEDITETTSLA